MAAIKNKKDNSFIEETDEDLLVIISMKDDKESSNLAFTEFHRRFKCFIYGMAIKITTNLPSSEELRDAVFQNTLINVYRYCETFDTAGETDSNKIRKRIHGWLVIIAKNELRALLRDQQSTIDPEILSSSFYEKPENENDTNNEVTYSEEIVSKALKTLKNKEQHIFMTYWLYYEPGKGSQAKNLPDDIRDELAKKYETTPENIRQIISRSKKKVFSYLRNSYKLKRS